ncbi:hypothetical protein GQR58_001790 [Nymphon striatum]|nr:hypothetical protein GQR58_001790 [Nymphon striatum]
MIKDFVSAVSHSHKVIPMQMLLTLNYFEHPSHRAYAHSEAPTHPRHSNFSNILPVLRMHKHEYKNDGHQYLFTSSNHTFCGRMSTMIYMVTFSECDHKSYVGVRTPSVLPLFMPAPRFKSAQQNLLPVLMERWTAAICLSMTFNMFFCGGFAKKKYFERGPGSPVSCIPWQKLKS